VGVNVAEGTKRNVSREETLSGMVRRVKRGEPRRTRKYDLTVLESSQKTDFESWDTHYDGTKSFYILDHDGDLIFMEMLNDLEFRYLSTTILAVSLDLLEVL
jgi:hypothetical protein